MLGSWALMLVSAEVLSGQRRTCATHFDCANFKSKFQLEPKKLWCLAEILMQRCISCRSPLRHQPRRASGGSIVARNLSSLANSSRDVISSDVTDRWTIKTTPTMINIDPTAWLLTDPVMITPHVFTDERGVNLDGWVTDAADAQNVCWEGSVVNGVLNGPATARWKHLTWQGSMLRGKRHGPAKIVGGSVNTLLNYVEGILDRESVKVIGRDGAVMTLPFDEHGKVQGEVIFEHTDGSVVKRECTQGALADHGTRLELDQSVYRGGLDECNRCHGVGRITMPDMGVLIGEWDHGHLDTRVPVTDTIPEEGGGQTIYQGFMNDRYLRHGHGLLTSGTLSWEGQFKEGELEGRVVHVSDGIRYEGALNQNLLPHDDDSRWVFPDGSVLEGAVVDGRIERSKVKMTWPDSRVWSGPVNEFYEPHGQGEMRIGSEVQTGTWIDGVRQE